MALSTLKPVKQLLFVCVLLFVSGCRHREKVQVVAKARTATKTETQKYPANENTKGRSEFCQVLKLSEKDVQQNKLYSFSDDWYGTPYKYAGCDKKGVDCSCFINVLYQQVYGKSLPRSA